MTMKSITRTISSTLMLTVSLWLTGCGSSNTTVATNAHTEHHEGDGHDHSHDGHDHKPGDGHDHGKKGDDHSGWWCAEHGIPEGECSMCDSKVAADFQQNGDWCKDHERGKSQCFICNPKAKEKYAAMYRAKYGTEPPAIEEETPGEKKSGA